MSFYSSLCLIANADVRSPSPEQITALLRECGVIGPTRKVGDIGNLSEDLSEYFVAHKAREKNESLFAPDSVGFHEKIEILDPDDEFTGKGWAITIHGNGYFFPLTNHELSSFLDTPKIQKMSELINGNLGGRFKWPLIRGRKILNKALIRNPGGWCWFGSQSL